MRSQDHEFFERELASFVPDRVFDAHTHLCHPAFHPNTIPHLPDPFGSEEYFYWTNCLHPNRDVSAFFLTFIWPYSADADFDLANNWTAQNTSSSTYSSRSHGAFYVRPQDDPEWVRQEVKRLKLSGLKCYYAAATVDDPANADIPDYLPEPIVKVANDEGWPITLHLVKHRAVADPANIHWIRHYCRSFPDMKLILAHSARGFQPANNLAGLQHLLGLDNLYFDTSANCETFAHQVVLKLFGHKKVLYGTDTPICSLLRGTNFAVGDGFIWLNADTQKDIWDQSQPNAGKPVLLGLEHLRSLKWAAWALGLTDTQIEDIFYNNAIELFQE